MDRGIPSFNRVVVQKMQQHSMQTHYQKLFSIQRPRRPKPVIATNHLCRSNLKKEQISQERSTEIDKSNVILFQKMKKIMSRPDPLNSNSNHRRVSSRKFANHIQRINQENQKILERLLKLKPTIDNKKIQQERKKQLAILKSMGRYSYHQKTEKNDSDEFKNQRRFRSTEREEGQMRESRKNNLETTASLAKFASSYMLPLNPRPRYSQQDGSSQNDELKISEVYFQKQMLKLEERRRRMNTSVTHHSPSQKRRMISSLEERVEKSPRRKSTILLNKSILLFATFKKIGNKIYKVQINRRHNLYEVVCMDVSASDRRLIMEICQEEGNELLSTTDYDYQSIVDCLQVDKEISLDREKLRNCRQDFSQDLPSPSPMKLKAKKQQNKLLSNITEQPNESSVHLQDFQGQPSRTQARAY